MKIPSKFNSLSDIKRQFNSDKRILEDLVAYGLADGKSGVAVDPYEKLRADLILQELLAGLRSKNLKGPVLDVGCGVGHLMHCILEEGIDCEGIDIAEGVVNLAANLLESHGFPRSKVVLRDFLRLDRGATYSAAIANGVIWYYEDRLAFLKKVHSVLTPGGIALVIHRNDLFNLFALNEGTLGFFFTHFFEHMPLPEQDEFRSRIINEISGLRLPIQKHTSSVLNKAYDNPLCIHDIYTQAGFSVKNVCYAYIHPRPPRFLQQMADPEVYAQAHQAHARNWQGMFTGSQFLVIAEKA